MKEALKYAIRVTESHGSVIYNGDLFDTPSEAFAAGLDSAKSFPNASYDVVEIRHCMPITPKTMYMNVYTHRESHGKESRIESILFKTEAEAKANWSADYSRQKSDSFIILRVAVPVDI